MGVDTAWGEEEPERRPAPQEPGYALFGHNIELCEVVVGPQVGDVYLPGNLFRTEALT